MEASATPIVPGQGAPFASTRRTWPLYARWIEAKTLWVKLIGNKDLGAYEYVKARGDLGEPQWPDKSYRELIELAFTDRVIDTTEHPVIRDLNGEM